LRVVWKVLVGYGFGFCFLELFAQLGGGINTKTVNVVGVDLIGKVEKGIPKDDPRSPTIIANLVSL
jgi:K(+)-stimulated pyrophosphate-energized sodium pump